MNELKDDEHENEETNMPSKRGKEGIPINELGQRDSKNNDTNVGEHRIKTKLVIIDIDILTSHLRVIPNHKEHNDFNDGGGYEHNTKGGHV
jgi:hypothetical protein